jgi:hypothetical protein
VVALFLLPILIAAVWFVALALGLVDR